MGEDIPDTKSKAVTVETNFERKLIGPTAEADGQPQLEQKPLFNTEPERIAVKATLKVFEQYERKLKSSKELLKPEVQKEIAEKVKEACTGSQQELPGAESVDYEEVVAQVCPTFVEMSIDIPRIIIVPSDDATYGFKDFDLEPPKAKLRPVSDEILLQNLQNNEQYRHLYLRLKIRIP